MDRIFVNRDIELLGLEEGDILFYRPDENLYERMRSDTIGQEGMLYSISESVKYHMSYLMEWIAEGYLKVYYTPDLLDCDEHETCIELLFSEL